MYRPAGGHSLSSDQMLDHWGQALAELIIKRTLHIDGCENLLRWDAAIKKYTAERDREEIDSASLQKFTVSLLEMKSQPRLQISQLDEIDESMRSVGIDFIS